MDTKHQRTLAKSLPGVEPQSGEKQDRPDEAGKPKNALQEREGERNPEHRSSGEDNTLLKETYHAPDRLYRRADKLTALYKLFEIILTERQRINAIVAKEFARN